MPCNDAEHPLLKQRLLKAAAIQPVRRVVVQPEVRRGLEVALLDAGSGAFGAVRDGALVGDVAAEARLIGARSVRPGVEIVVESVEVAKVTTWAAALSSAQQQGSSRLLRGGRRHVHGVLATCRILVRAECARRMPCHSACHHARPTARRAYHSMTSDAQIRHLPLPHHVG